MQRKAGEQDRAIRFMCTYMLREGEGKDRGGKGRTVAAAYALQGISPEEERAA